MATDISGPPGRDYTFNTTVLDKDGDPQDLTAVDGYALVASVEGRTIAKWCNRTLAGFLPIEETDAENGLVKIELPADRTADFENMTVVIEPIIQVIVGGEKKKRPGKKERPDQYHQ